jgi:hypothetical protein
MRVFASVDKSNSGKLILILELNLGNLPHGAQLPAVAANLKNDT